MASDIFAKIGDIKGESIDSKHKDEIELLELVLGVSRLRVGIRVAAAGRERARRTSTISPSPTRSTRPPRCC